MRKYVLFYPLIFTRNIAFRNILFNEENKSRLLRSTNNFMFYFVYNRKQVFRADLTMTLLVLFTLSQTSGLLLSPSRVISSLTQQILFMFYILCVLICGKHAEFKVDEKCRLYPCACSFSCLKIA